jgi:hypothetical protein
MYDKKIQGHLQKYELRLSYAAFFLSKSQTFGLGQLNWADKLGRLILGHLGSMFFINQPLFLKKKTKPEYPHANI